MTRSAREIFARDPSLTDTAYIAGVGNLFRKLILIAPNNPLLFIIYFWFRDCCEILLIVLNRIIFLLILELLSIILNIFFLNIFFFDTYKYIFNI